MKVEPYKEYMADIYDNEGKWITCLSRKELKLFRDEINDALKKIKG